jgi:molybdenum cofactor guanylyltransferase
MSWIDRVAERRQIGVMVERHALQSRWATHRWHPGAVLLEVPDTAPWTKLAEEGGVARYYAGPAELVLVPSESESYLYNLAGREPQVWIVLRPCEPKADGRDVVLESATVAAGEAEALAGGSEIIVESVPMPGEIANWVAEFVRAHPAAPKAFKRKRSHYVSEGKALADQMKAKREDE